MKFLFLFFLTLLTSCSFELDKDSFSSTSFPLTAEDRSFEFHEDAGQTTLSFSVKEIVSPITIHYQILSESADSGDDVSPAEGSLEVLTGQSTVEVPIEILEDTLDENNEVFKIKLSVPQFPQLGELVIDSTIIDNDTPPSLSIGDISVNENDSFLMVPISLSEASGRSVSISLSTLDGSASSVHDFIPLNSHIVEFAAGETSQIVNLMLIDDNIVEGDELLQLSLTSPTHATIAVPSAQVTIIENDIPPIVNEVYSSNPDGSYHDGDELLILIDFDKVVNVSGTPRILLETGTINRYANYTSGTGTSTLTFTYIIQPDDNSSDLDYVSTNSLELNSGEIQDVYLNDANLTLPVPGGPESLADHNNFSITDTAPAIAQLTLPSNDVYRRGENLDFTVSFDQKVFVTGTPSISLTINKQPGSSTRQAEYFSGDGTRDLIFRYQALKEDYDSDGISYTTSITHNSGSTIKDSGGKDAALGLPTLNSANILVDAVDHQIEFTQTEVGHIESNSNYSVDLSVTPNFLEDQAIEIHSKFSLATEGSDFTFTESHTFLAHQATLSIPYSILDDLDSEDSEQIILVIERTDESLILGSDYIFLHAIKDDEKNSLVKYVSLYHGNHCQIREDDKVYCAGANSLGRLGIGAFSEKVAVPTVISSSETFTKTSSGTSVCGITTGQKLFCWGDDYFGSIGDGHPIQDLHTPVEIDTGTSYIEVSASSTHTCGITSTGVLKCWGANHQGGIGDGTTSFRSSPVVVNSGTSYIKVSTGSFFTCAVTSTNELQCWGHNHVNQLGDGTTTNRHTPVVIDSGVSYSDVTVTYSGSCGLLTTGGLKCWGRNSNYIVGDGTNTTRTTPVPVDSGVSYQKLSAGADHMCGLTVGNNLKCWGSGSYGQIGFGQSSSQSVPSQVNSTNYKDIFLGGNTTCALTNDDFLQCMGNNESAELGNSYMTKQYQAVEDESQMNFKIISGDKTRCGITTDDDLYCWGGHFVYAYTGDGTNTVRPLPVRIDPGEKYSLISVKEHFTCGITLSGQAKCWGQNHDGEIGDGTEDTSLVPVEVLGNENYIDLSTSSYATCGLISDGTAKCWGGNSFGTLGDGTNSDSSVPVLVSTAEKFSSIRVGGQTTCGITTNQKLFCWGRNTSGNVGDNSTTSRNVPVEIDVGVQYQSVSIEFGFTCGLTVGDTVKCWGNNGAGTVGDGTTTQRLIPTSIDDVGTTYKAVSVGSNLACGITSTDNVKCWGSNSSYGLNTGDLMGANISSPKNTLNGDTFNLINVGYQNACGLTTSGTMKCWGNNYNGGFLTRDLFKTYRLTHIYY